MFIFVNTICIAVTSNPSCITRTGSTGTSTMATTGVRMAWIWNGYKKVLLDTYMYAVLKIIYRLKSPS